MQLVGGPESGYTGLEKDVEYDTNALGDQGSYPKFYEWNGAQHMAFPTLTFDADHVPQGNSVGMCMGLSWVPMNKRN